MSLTYAIADLHGRFDLLESAVSEIRKHAGATPFKIITMGDYVDRGPESREIIEFLMAWQHVDSSLVCLKGNHEEMMVETIRKPLDPDWWIANGGDATLISYGHPRKGSYQPDIVPADHLAWLDALPLMHVDEYRVFVHAGVVGWKGQAIVIPGRSYSGKSTLVAELVRAGATYYSDEYAVLDSRGRVHPFDKPLELRDEGQFRQTKVTAAELGGHSGTKPLPVGLVLMTQFKSGARWRPRKLTAGKGVLEMLFNTVSARRSPEKALQTLQRVTAQADVLKGVRGNATEVVPAVLRRVEGRLRLRS